MRESKLHKPLSLDVEEETILGRFLRYQTTRSNTVRRCIKAVEDYRKNRAAEKLSHLKLATAPVPPESHPAKEPAGTHLERTPRRLCVRKLFRSAIHRLNKARSRRKIQSPLLQ